MSIELPQYILNELLAATHDLLNGMASDFNYQLQFIVGEIAVPHVLMRPKLYLDGDQWCALYGDNLQEGLAGFGDTPAAAMADFNTAWQKPIKESSDA